jgi:phosphatidylglycerophosphate synthase
VKFVPNSLSASRIPLGVGLALAVAVQDWQLAWWLFLAAMVTDLLDGPLARRYETESDFGNKLDHNADLVVVLGLIAGFAYAGFIHLRDLPWGAFTLSVGILIARRASAGQTSDNVRVGKHQASIPGILAYGFATVMTLMGAVLLVAGYGWHTWYLPIAVLCLGAFAFFKRGKLRPELLRMVRPSALPLRPDHTLIP